MAIILLILLRIMRFKKNAKIGKKIIACKRSWVRFRLAPPITRIKTALEFRAIG
jgi:hypothetical protein